MKKSTKLLSTSFENLNNGIYTLVSKTFNKCRFERVVQDKPKPSGQGEKTPIMNPIIKVFKLFGTLDNLEGKQLCQEVNDSLKKDVNVVLIDLQNVTFMDSSGLAALASVRKNVLAARGKLFLCSISDPVKILLELTSTDRVFEICATRDEFEVRFDVTWSA